MWKKIKRIFKMAILISIHTGLKFGGYEQAPPPELLTTEYTEPAMTALSNLAYGELPTLPTVNLPQITLPGVSELEQKLIDYGSSIITNLMANQGKMPEAYELGMAEIKKTLGETYDPFTSAFYQGLRETSLKEEEAGVGQVRRRSQLGGMLYSEPSERTEAEYRATMGTGRTTMLGEMYETERGRKQAMIPQLLQYGQFEQNIPYANLQAIEGFAPTAGLPRNIASQQAIINQQTGVQQALANQQVGIQQAMLPYTAQAPILSELANYGNWYEPEMYYQPGLLDYVAPIAGAMMK
jgi:hypothetical protein